MGKKRKRASGKTGSESGKTHSAENDRQIALRVTELAAPLCEAEGMELVHVEYQREARGQVLRIYIDKPGGVRLDDCVCISRQLGDILDVSFETRGAYHLEVSSPGPDRPLVKADDFIRFQGSTAKIRTARPVDGSRNFQGMLVGMSEGMIKILVNDETVLIPFDEIIRARLVS